MADLFERRPEPLPSAEKWTTRPRANAGRMSAYRIEDFCGRISSKELAWRRAWWLEDAFVGMDVRLHLGGTV